MKVNSINTNVYPKNKTEKQSFKSNVIVTVKHPDTYAGGLNELFNRAVKVVLEKKAILDENNISSVKQRISNEIKLGSTDVIITERGAHINDKKWYEVDIKDPEMFIDRTSELEKV